MLICCIADDQAGDKSCLISSIRKMCFMTITREIWRTHLYEREIAGTSGSLVQVHGLPTRWCFDEEQTSHQ